ncbi:DNA binding protein [Gordonia phage Malibo]|nr:DNA binding protein [Gordonia phage Malibo]
MTAIEPTEDEMSLARRQLRVGELAAAGHTVADIAEQMGVHFHTVDADLDAMGFDRSTIRRGMPYSKPRTDHCFGSQAQPATMLTGTRGYCRVCGGRYTLRADGTVRNHAGRGGATAKGPHS